jgi:two-component system response regulator WspF
MKLAYAHRDRLLREALRRTLARSGHEVLWAAADQTQLEREARRSPPSLLLIELEMLGAHAELLPKLKDSGASVIVLVSGRGSGAGYEALGLGALALLEPPTLDESGELIGAAKTLAAIQRLGILVGSNESAQAHALPSLPGAPLAPILALGASTGGPLALARVLGSLPPDLPAAVIVVQHIEPEFTDGLAEWLGSQCALPVTLAQRGETPVAGRVYLAGARGHLVLLPSRQFGHQAGRASELHVPSVDTLFLSLAASAEPGAAVILTGMGNDGALGLAELRRKGWYTLAQDEATSIVFGMPRAAISAGAAQGVLPLPQIGPALVRHLQRGLA